MEISEVFRLLEKYLEKKNSELGFSKADENESSLTFSGEKGAYRIVYDTSEKIIAFDCTYDNGKDAQFNTISRSLFDTDSYNERDVKSLSNEIDDEISSMFNAKKKVDIEKVKMPKAVSRTKAKNGVINYDKDSLANRFGTLYPDMKEAVKANVVQYGEFLPETFFIEIGTARVIEVIKNGSDAECKKLFKMLNEVYEDGTNEVQDIIGVTILGEMKNDSALMATADKYMSDYMSGPVHEINKITAKNGRLSKLLKNPPAYKPKKKKANFMQNALQPNNMNR